MSGQNARQNFFPFLLAHDRKKKKKFFSSEERRGEKKFFVQEGKKKGAIDTVLLYLVSFKERIILYF